MDGRLETETQTPYAPEAGKTAHAHPGDLPFPPRLCPPLASLGLEMPEMPLSPLRFLGLHVGPPDPHGSTSLRSPQASTAFASQSTGKKRKKDRPISST